MRLYQNFKESFNEITRDLKEMGIEVSTTSVQDIKGDFKTLELQNYHYMVTQPTLVDIPVKDYAWCEAEFDERVSEHYHNPGHAWKMRHSYWFQFLHNNKFSYSYNETMSDWVRLAEEELKRDPSSRRAFIPVFAADRDYVNLQEHLRIPCTIGYWLYIRRGELHLTYLQRSSDFYKHFANDVWLAHRLQYYFCNVLKVKMGTFSHWLGSLHVFSEEVKDVF